MLMNIDRSCMKVLELKVQMATECSELFMPMNKQALPKPFPGAV